MGFANYFNNLLRYSQCLWKHKNYTSTIANVWVPHNLSELAKIIENYLSTGEIQYENLAPDFPTGGIIINKVDLPTIYKTGKGKVILRGKAEIKGNSILITEIPYQVYVEPFITQIKDLIMKDEITGISNILNKSDKKRLLIEIECESSPASVLTQLYKKTSLQKSYSPNQFALVGKTPKLLNLKEYLDIYIQHNFDCIKRENEYELNKAKDKLEITLGLIRALEDIDNIIVLIKASESSVNAVQNLIKKYNFTERQAKAIVDMKLGKLAHLEKIELNKEKEDLTSTIERCEDIINHQDRQKEIYLERFTAFVKKYGNDRRTKLVQIDLPKNKKEKEVAEVVPEDVVVVISKTGMIKRIPRQSFKTQRRNGKGVKNEGDLNLETISTNTVDNLMFFTDKGKMYRLLVDKVPVGNNTTKGTYIGDFIKIEPTEKVIAVTSLHKNTNAQYVLFITKKGMVKKTYLKEYTSTNRNSGIIAIKLKDNDTIANVTFVNEEELILLSKNNHAIRFETKNIAPIGRNATGVIGMKLTDGDEIITGLPIKHTTDDLAVFNEMGLGKKIKLSELPSQNRGGKGVLIFSKGNCQGGCLIDDKDKILILGQTNSICIESTDVPTLGRTADGNIMIKGTRIKKIIKI